MNTDPYTLAIAALVAILSFTGYMMLDVFFGKKQQSEELKNRIASGQDFGMDEGDEALLSLEEKKSPMALTLSGILRMIGVDVDGASEKLKDRFAHAGVKNVDAPVYYLFMQRIMSIVFVFFSIPFLLSDEVGSKYLSHIILGVLLIIVGLFGPHLYLKNSIDKRKKVLLRSFPDALDLMLVCVESGLALDASLGRVCQELGRAHPQITAELNRTRLELALLNDRTRALMNLGHRTDLVPFRSLAAALIQTEKFGTSLTDTLRVLSDDYRQTRLLLAENKANRLPALITIPLICMLMPAFMLIILGPAAIRLSQQGGVFGNH